MSSRPKPVKASRVPVKGNPRRAMLAAADILDLARYGREQYQYLEDINTNLADQRALERANVKMNISAIKRLTPKNNTTTVTEVTYDPETKKVEDVHQALVLLHEGSYYLFDANHSRDTDEDYRWWSHKDYEQFEFIKPLTERIDSYHCSDDIEGGLCSLFALMVEKTFKSLPFDEAMNNVITFTPEQLVQLYMRM